MTKTNKETAVIASAGSAVGGLLVALIMLSFTNAGDSKKEYDNKLNSKVDHTEYAIKCDEIKKEIDSKVDQKEFDMSQKNMDVFIRNQLIIQEDIKNMLPKIRQ